MIYVMLLQKKTNKMDLKQKTKKIAVLLIAILFFSNTSFAEKTISEEKFSHLVDYANCLYLKTFIEGKGDATFNETYQANVKPYLERASLDEYENISYQEIVNILTNNSQAKELAKKINERKQKYNTHADDISLVNSLIAKTWEGISLIQTSDIIIQDINTKLAKIPEKPIEVSVGVQAPIDTQKGSTPINDDSFLDESWIDKNTSIAIYALLALNLLAFTILIFRIRTLSKNKSNFNSDEVYQKVMNDDRILNLLKSKVPVNPVDPTNRFQLTLDDISKRLLKTENSLIKLEKLIGQKPNELPEKTDKFLKGKNGNVFSRVESSSDGCFYKLLNEKNETAEFEFCANIEDVRHQTNAVFDNVSELSGSIQNAKSIQTTEKGKVKLVNGKWEVYQKAKIKFI